jgi:8-oxo-dGTP diphosphatase
MTVRVLLDEEAVERDRFAGEDDDEDHPWVVHTDAPAFMAEVVAEEYDAWVDAAHDQHDAPPPAPLDLPQGPRRIKGHWTEQ